MNPTIRMGNDEFILYIRKNYPRCGKTNDHLGRSIWKWLEANDAASSRVGSGNPVPCAWGETASHTGETGLPLTATQFQFRRSLLPMLYDYLDELGSESGARQQGA